jgi:hypothetical protein
MAGVMAAAQALAQAMRRGGGALLRCRAAHTRIQKFFCVLFISSATDMYSRLPLDFPTLRRAMKTPGNPPLCRHTPGLTAA